MAELQEQLDQFRHIYNHERGHRALGRKTPAEVYSALPKAKPSKTPTINTDRLHRIRHDHVDQFGKLTLRYNGTIRHLGIGKEHAKKPVIMLVGIDDVTVIHLKNGEKISTHHINKKQNYWRNQLKRPGRWPQQEK